MIEVRYYVTRGGQNVADDWITSLNNARTEARIMARIERLRQGNFGDCRLLGISLHELRLDVGPGYRIYYAMIGRARVLPLNGGDKRRQSSDIERAREFFKDYMGRVGIQ
jgi:putative addiction module killer protein